MEWFDPGCSRGNHCCMIILDTHHMPNELLTEKGHIAGHKETSLIGDGHQPREYPSQRAQSFDEVLKNRYLEILVIGLSIGYYHDSPKDRFHLGCYAIYDASPIELQKSLVLTIAFAQSASQYNAGDMVVRVVRQKMRKRNRSRHQVLDERAGKVLYIPAKSDI
jgi:hypothetical protein